MNDGVIPKIKNQNIKTQKKHAFKKFKTNLIRTPLQTLNIKSAEDKLLRRQNLLSTKTNC